MALSNVQGYLASDGKFFFKDNKGLAEAHEAELQFRAWCNMNICRGGEWSADIVSRAILENFIVTPK